MGSSLLSELDHYLITAAIITQRRGDGWGLAGITKTADVTIEKHHFLGVIVSLFMMMDNAHQSEDKVIKILSHMTGEDRLEKWLLPVIEQEGVVAKLTNCVSVQQNGMKIDIWIWDNSETRSEEGCLNAWVDGSACGWRGWSSAAVNVWSNTRGVKQTDFVKVFVTKLQRWLLSVEMTHFQVDILVGIKLRSKEYCKDQVHLIFLSSKHNYNWGWILLPCWCELHFERTWGYIW